ncbi:uncharacterized protein LAESUDRAFT_720043 [Laetiporus sulphureus 93-53]|uniref:SP-RING-type domain-containing protein n=1 Tax=Laetiporus sulphureus 93-53 TaxID=1314785 RepID=A0A165HQY3_9APHY|nr:uncharacterized protein LAESUDRAFT_720043 [Laetiporus sulphureus 93-53]KZT12066.1 hypothetical protein LAESUDRAFT_720043 [Laetiporus sulphureus 93-53]
MPVASSSRRIRREHSDVIEEDNPTQRTVEDVEDGEEDEEQEGDEVQKPRRSKKSVRKESKRKVSREQPEDEEEELEDFGDQPLDKSNGAKLAGFASDWNMMRRQNHTPYYTLVRDVATVIAEFAGSDGAEQDMVEMDEIMRSLIDTEFELVAHEKTLGELNQKVSQREKIANIVDLYEEEVKRKVGNYNSKTSRQKYAKSEEYITFKSAIYEVQNPDQAMPPITEFIPKEDEDESDDDDDLIVGGVTQDYKCPLTLTILVDPLTSDKCGHSFSASAIRDYLGTSRNARKECPSSGCKKMICLGDLRPNKELAKKAKDAARRERMRSDESDGEEVVE